MILSWCLFLIVGAASGFIAGLLGLGGGVIIVPMLSLVFIGLDIDPDLAHRLAVGTSLASIMFTAASSARKHNQFRPLDWKAILPMAPSLVIGTLCGSFLSALLPVLVLRIIFLVFLVGLAIRLSLFSREPESAHKVSPVVMAVCGFLIGMLASIVGIAGGVILVPFMLWIGLPMHGAIGAASMLGVFVALSGTAGAVVNGLIKGGLPPGTIGYVHIEALAGVVLAGIFTAPLGARTAHKLSPGKLRLIFGVVMLLMAAGMAWNTVGDILRSG